ncbi:5-deoxy-glucuronate isomerase [Shouchella shacheensis]|uniref:5-deoxy-glucuronate isomerase n=1 Tax=Shouchella shacheensis TaxID=1649580 RepID=UPI0007400701|nr:5-deoxy-glucuronate isomerase [Shouchella shacheensis]
MSQYIVSQTQPDENGRVLQLTPESAGWEYIGFEVFQLQPGQTIHQKTEDQEVVVVLVSGKANVKTDHKEWNDIGDRMSVFEKKPAYSVYLPPHDSFHVEATTEAEIAVCKAPGKGTYEARLIGPDDVDVAKRGSGSMQREIHNILPEEKPADSLFVIEVFTPEGNWSSYPPHKHDENNLPQETYLEETYYHKNDKPENGFAIQRLYTDDLSLNENLTVKDSEVVIVPKGYHPVSAPPGYNLYYMNVMAGPVRKWQFTDDKDHEWLKK